MSTQQKGAELDKLKRRMIRTVARLLKEKKTEDEVFEELKKESGSNCKSLWLRMRSLTMKKLKRLLDADDRVDNVPAVARMSLTDWLLYDLVIVHEKIDVIDRNALTSSKVLNNLFSLVQMFSIEGRSGNDLAEAWTAATVHYNSKGHQCSPMLMQRRWYQIKELTRHKLYKFWFNYRGNQRLLNNAKQDPPTELQKAIALRYPELITEPFPEWEERIEKKLVIMPEEFEVKMRKKALMKPSDESAPDVVIVERKIDTITLVNSDSESSEDENSRESNGASQTSTINTDNEKTSQTPQIVQVKTEPQDSYENIDTTDYSTYEPQSEESIVGDRFQAEIERLKIEEDKIFTDTALVGNLEDQIENQGEMMPLITNIKGAVDTENEDSFENDVSMAEESEILQNSLNEDTKKDVLISDKELEFIENNLNETVGKDKTQNDVEMSEEADIIENNLDAQSQESILIDDDEDEITPLKNVAALVKNRTIHNVIGSTCPEKMITTGIGVSSLSIDRNDHVTEVNDVAPIIDKIEIDEPFEAKMEMDIEMLTEYNIEECEEDIISQVHKDSENSAVGENIGEMTSKIQESPNLDFDDEISDMNFADDGIEFADDGIEYNESDNDQDGPNDSPAQQEREQTQDENEATPKFDLKLLMHPVVYTTKLDEMAVYKGRPLYDTVEKKELLDKIVLESKPTSTKSINVAPVKDENHDTNEVDDDLFQNDSSDESDCDVIDENKKVMLSSNILQKPKSRSYNPIQLCKNPDFNTRLKRLNVGFFSSTRNRVLLKACKPMTIDLSKAFESKLVDGTMYLKPSDHVIKIEEENVVESSVSILPSAVAVQSLMDTTDVDKILQEELKKRMLERNKTIKLPNISVVRQINQHLLMAEVAPIMAQTDKSARIQQNITTVEKGNEISLNSSAKRLKLDPDTGSVEHWNDSKSDNYLTTQVKIPVNVETYTNSNENKDSTNEKPSTQALPVFDINKSKTNINKPPEKPKKVRGRQTHINKPSWLTKTSQERKSNSESLLTIDTLYKMLNALDPCKEYASKMYKPKNKSKNVCKPLDQKEKSNKVDEADKSEKQPEVSAEKLKSTLLPTCISKKRKNCCWARSKIVKLTSKTPNIRLYKHRCISGFCKCCCREHLRQVELDTQVKILETNADDNLTMAIEQVVQQSHVLSNEVEQPAVRVVDVDPDALSSRLQSPTRINVGLQANMDEVNDDHLINNESGNTVTVTNIVSEVERAKKPENEGVTIDLVDEDAKEPQLSKIQSPTPVIRVFSGTTNTSTKPNIGYKNLALDRKITPQTSSLQIKPPTMPKASNRNKSLSKYKLYSKEPEAEPKFPCSCRPNVVVDRSSSMLLVDGSNECLRHSKLRVSKETRIYLNRKHMSVTERPFYVGKNKILLTNVLPPRTEPPTPDPGMIMLPDGVQVVLLPDGTITYLVDPNVELTVDQLAAMPAILGVIQQQIKASGITLPVPPVPPLEAVETIDLDDDADPKPIETTDNIANLENSNIDGKHNKANVSTELSSSAPLDSIKELKENSITTNSVVDQPNLQNEVNQESSSMELNTVPETVENTTDGEHILPAKETAGINEEHTAKETDIPETEKLISSIEPTVNKNDEADAVSEHNYALESPEKNKAAAGTTSEDTNNAAASASRNLLSDLMEMSGILEEDTAPAAQESSLIMTVPESMIQPITLPINPGLSLTQPLIPVPALSPLSKRKHSITAQIDDKTHELNPITSFAELKYACDHDGLFFKLDLNNGIIVPINVCIQKSPVDSAGTRPNITSLSEVIDLTDEQGVSLKEQNPTSLSMRACESVNKTDNDKLASRIMPKKLSSMMPTSANEKSLLKVRPPFSSGLSVNEHKKQELMTRLSNNLKPLKILQKQRQVNILRKNLLTRNKDISKRHMYLNKIEANIDLVDSDAPMEEEFLIDNSSDSDDEPLAKIAKKKKTADNEDPSQESENGSQVVQETQEKSVAQNNTVLQCDEFIDFEEAIDAIESPAPVPSHPTVEADTEPVPTQLVLSGDAINQPILLNEAFLASNDADDESSQDDCILGV